MFGMSKVWAGSSDGWTVLRGEVVNAEVSHLFRVRDQNPFYIHTFTKQGHTHRGQVLGSPAAYGGAGSTVALDRYSPWGRWTVAWRRVLQTRRGMYWVSGNVERDAADVVHSLTLDGLLFRGPLEIRGALTGAYEFNRYFEDDVFNANLSVGIRWVP